jgi:hypothetical protein
MNTVHHTQPARATASASDTVAMLLGDNDISRSGVRARSCVSVWVGSWVRLDTDPETDPLQCLTAQVSGHNSDPCSTQTDPSRGLPHGGIYA